MFFVSDEQWAMTMARGPKGRGSVAFLIGTGVLSWLAWMGSTLCGRVLGAFIDDPTQLRARFRLHRHLPRPAARHVEGPRRPVPWIVGALAAIVTSRLIEGNWYIIIGGLVGSFAGALADSNQGAPRCRLRR